MKEKPLTSSQDIDVGQMLQQITATETNNKKGYYGLFILEYNWPFLEVKVSPIGGYLGNILGQFSHLCVQCVPSLLT